MKTTKIADNGPGMWAKQLILFFCLGLVACVPLLAGYAFDNVRATFTVFYTLPVVLFLIFRWYAHTTLMGIGSGYSLGADALGWDMAFALSDGRVMRGTVVRYSLCWDGFVVRTETGEYYRIELDFGGQPRWGRRYLAVERVELT